MRVFVEPMLMWKGDAMECSGGGSAPEGSDTDPGLESRRVDGSAVADSDSHEWRLVNQGGRNPNASRGPGDAGAQAPNAVLSSNQCAALGDSIFTHFAHCSASTLACFREPSPITIVLDDPDSPLS